MKKFKKFCAMAGVAMSLGMVSSVFLAPAEGSVRAAMCNHGLTQAGKC